MASIIILGWNYVLSLLEAPAAETLPSALLFRSIYHYPRGHPGADTQRSDNAIITSKTTTSFFDVIMTL